MVLDRRDFIVKSSAFGLGLSLAPEFLLRAKQDFRSITIMHTNDTHSRIDPFPDNDKYHASKGGVVNRAAVIERIRNEVENSLLLDAGDIFQGTPYFNKYQGNLEMQVMEAMGYDAMTLGNHDFDIGIEGFEKAYRANASFSIICANYDFSNTSIKDLVIPYKIFERNDIKVGIFGLGIELNGLVPKAMYGEIQYHDPIAVATKYAKILKFDMECDLVICLSHLGDKYEEAKVSDHILASEVDHIDLIIGAHTHTFHKTPKLITRRDSGATLINQVGHGGINLGRIDFILSDSKKRSKHKLIELSR